MSGAIKPWKLTISVDAFCGLVSNQFAIVINFAKLQLAVLINHAISQSLHNNLHHNKLFQKWWL